MIGQVDLTKHVFLIKTSMNDKRCRRLWHREYVWECMTSEDLKGLGETCAHSISHKYEDWVPETLTIHHNVSSAQYPLFLFSEIRFLYIMVLVVLELAL